MNFTAEGRIFGEGGKKKLFDRIIIRLVGETFGKHDFSNMGNTHHFFVVMDADGVQTTVLCSDYCQTIRHNIRSRGTSRFSCKRPDNTDSYDFYNKKDTRYRCIVDTSHVPTSLEKELVRKGIEKIQKNRTKIAADLRIMDPHLALKKLAEILGLSVDQLILHSVQENWFTQENWYKEICIKLESYFSEIQGSDPL
ncbi:MAG: hypothetical protein Q7V05_03835 [Methanoregula sp.]|nr:hypothetical protein [Methanoregula sp.]